MNIYRHSLAKRIKRWFLSFQLKFLYIVFTIRNIFLLQYPIHFKVNEINFQLVPKGSIIVDLWLGLRFKRLMLEFILRVLRPGMTFFDIGANVGPFTVGAAKKNKDIRVYSFEPITWKFNILQENIRLNHLSNVFPCQIALGDYVGKTTLKANISKKDEKVTITTLDSFIKTKGIPKLDLIRLNVKGAEFFVLRGAKKQLQLEKAPLIIYESSFNQTKRYEYHPVEIMWFLQDYGYSLYVLDIATGKVVPYQTLCERDDVIIAIKKECPFLDLERKT